MVGLDQTNLLLSYERAKTVSSLLVSRGVVLQQIQIAAAGSHSLVEGSPGDAQVNRRVTVQINNPEGCKTVTK
jgi:outer membrane protein OmpA-like peptidoglycan-associated protein